MFQNLQMISFSILEQFSAWDVLFAIKGEIFQELGPCKPLYKLFRLFWSKLQPKIFAMVKLNLSASQIKNTQAKDSISIGSRNFKKGFMYKSAFSWLKVQSCKLCNNKYMITSTQITNSEVVTFMAVLVYKLFSRKVLFINRKDNRNC